MRRENGFYVNLILLLIFLTFPYLIMYLRTNEGYSFTGFVYCTVDSFSYLSKMSNAEHGFAFLNNYSIGNNYGGYHFIFYLLLGKLSLLIGIPYVVMFHIARIGLSLLFLFSVYSLIEKINIFNGVYKHITVLLVLFGGSFKWMFDLILLMQGKEIENYLLVPEPIPSFAMAYMPHFVLVMIIQVIVLIYTIRYKENRNKNSCIIGVLLLIIALIHPFTAVLIGVSSGSYIFIRDVIERNLSIMNFIRLLLFGIIPLPYLIYSLYAFTHYPTLIEWNKQAVVRLNSVGFGVITMGGIIILAFIMPILKNNWKKDVQIFTWFNLIAILALFIPFNSNLRVLEGVGIYVMILLGKLISENKRISVITKYGIVIFITLSSLWVIIECLFLPTTRVTSYISNERKELHQYIQKNISYNDLIFSDELTGIYIPAYTGKRVAFGHHHETAKYKEWQEIWQKVINTGNMEKLKERNIRFYIINKSLVDSNYLKLLNNQYTIIFQNKQFVIYDIV